MTAKTAKTAKRDDAAYTPETWAYAGSRLGSDGKRTGAWSDPVDGRLRYWTDRGSFVVGAGYTLQIDRTDGDAVYRRGNPEFAHRDACTPAELLAWTIEHEKAERFLERQRAEARVKRQGSVIDQAAAPLCELAATVKTFGELETLMAAVRRRMIDAWDRK